MARIFLVILISIFAPSLGRNDSYIDPRCAIYVPEDYIKAIAPNMSGTVIDIQYEIVNFDNIDCQDHVRISA